MCVNWNECIEGPIKDVSTEAISNGDPESSVSSRVNTSKGSAMDNPSQYQQEAVGGIPTRAKPVRTGRNKTQAQGRDAGPGRTLSKVDSPTVGCRYRISDEVMHRTSGSSRPKWAETAMVVVVVVPMLPPQRAHNHLTETLRSPTL